jgi:hypothetical protein
MHHVVGACCSHVSEENNKARMRTAGRGKLTQQQQRQENGRLQQ